MGGTTQRMKAHGGTGHVNKRVPVDLRTLRLRKRVRHRWSGKKRIQVATSDDALLYTCFLRLHRGWLKNLDRNHKASLKTIVPDSPEGIMQGNMGRCLLLMFTILVYMDVYCQETDSSSGQAALFLTGDEMERAPRGTKKFTELSANMGAELDRSQGRLAGSGRNLRTDIPMFRRFFCDAICAFYFANEDLQRVFREGDGLVDSQAQVDVSTWLYNLTELMRKLQEGFKQLERDQDVVWPGGNTTFSDVIYLDPEDICLAEQTAIHEGGALARMLASEDRDKLLTIYRETLLISARLGHFGSWGPDYMMAVSALDDQNMVNLFLNAIGDLRKVLKHLDLGELQKREHERNSNAYFVYCEVGRYLGLFYSLLNHLKVYIDSSEMKTEDERAVLFDNSDYNASEASKCLQKTTDNLKRVQHDWLGKEEDGAYEIDLRSGVIDEHIEKVGKGLKCFYAGYGDVEMIQLAPKNLVSEEVKDVINSWKRNINYIVGAMKQTVNNISKERYERRATDERSLKDILLLPGLGMISKQGGKNTDTTAYKLENEALDKLEKKKGAMDWYEEYFQSLFKIVVQGNPPQDFEECIKNLLKDPEPIW